MSVRRDSGNFEQIAAKSEQQPKASAACKSPKQKKKSAKITPPKSKGKPYKYQDLIHHLDYECPRNKIYQCPLKCQANSRRSQKKMTKKQVAEHLKKECPKVEVTCQDCGETFVRENSGNHSCINYLKQIISN